MKGGVKEVVDSFLFLDLEDVYDKVKEMFKKCFGDFFVVVVICCKKFELWLKIYLNDSIVLRKYLDFLV